VFPAADVDAASTFTAEVLQTFGDRIAREREARVFETLFQSIPDDDGPGGWGSSAKPDPGLAAFAGQINGPLMAMAVCTAHRSMTSAESMTYSEARDAYLTEGRQIMAVARQMGRAAAQQAEEAILRVLALSADPIRIPAGTPVLINDSSVAAREGHGPLAGHAERTPPPVRSSRRECASDAVNSRERADRQPADASRRRRPERRPVGITGSPADRLVPGRHAPPPPTSSPRSRHAPKACAAATA